uniref:RNA polymerase sigma-70 region 3 domain-containing protein n=1 Tax=Aegilops tauschii subsp. strangulata TaxID=200361 RepID=A0A453A227_AEGTS
ESVMSSVFYTFCLCLSEIEMLNCCITFIVQERQEINRAREELSFELGRAPTDEETMKKVGLSPARYRDVVRMTRPTYSLHSRNRVTQEELIKEVTDVDAIGVDTHKHNRLLRLAIDDLVSTNNNINICMSLVSRC